MTGFKKFIINNPGYPECQNYFLTDELIKISPNNHLFTRSYPPDIKVDEGTLTIKCHNNLLGAIHMTTTMTLTVPPEDEKVEESTHVSGYLHRKL